MSLELAEIKFEDDGFLGDHNMPCAVCVKRHAIWNHNRRLFSPCWECQRAGYKLIKLNWFDRLLGRGEK
jgi:hypothetical protein